MIYIKRKSLLVFLFLGLLSVQVFAQSDNERAANLSKTKKVSNHESKEISPAVQIYFETNKSTIKSPEIVKLRRLLDTLDTKDEFRLALTGHTDSTGNDEANLRLSQTRVDEVFRYLFENDIDSTWMIRTYFGRSKPREKEESNEEKKSRNRRVEITIYEKPKPIEKPKPKIIYRDTCTLDTTIAMNGVNFTMKACDFKKICPRGANNCIKIKKFTSIEEIMGGNVPLRTTKGEGLNWGGAFDIRLPGDTCAIFPITMAVSLDANTYKRAKLQLYTKDGETVIKPNKSMKLAIEKGKDQNSYSFPLSCNGTYYLCGAMGKAKKAIILDKTRKLDEVYMISQSTMAIVPAKNMGNHKWEVVYSKIEDPTLILKSDGEVVASDINMNAVRKMKKPGFLRKKYKLKTKHLGGN